MADQFCAARVAEAPTTLPQNRTWIAWLSGAGVDARSRLGSARGWVRPDGLPFADEQNDLLAGDITQVFYPPALNELGARVPYGPFGGLVMTGSDPYGEEASSDRNCMDGDTFGSTGTHTMGGRSWGWGSTQNCTEPCLLYCMSIDRQVPVAPPRPNPSVYNYAFVSVASFTPGIHNYAWASAQCQSEAEDANLSGSYIAFFASGSWDGDQWIGVPAWSRLTYTQKPWMRVDGIPIVDDPIVVRDGGDLIAPICVTAAGGYVSSIVQTGAPTPTSDPTDDPNMSCNLWTDDSSNYKMREAFSTESSVEWFSSHDWTCSNRDDKFYCFQDDPP